MFNHHSDLKFNIYTHNRIAKQYELIHGEVYNLIEQNRLHESLLTAVSSIKTSSNIKKAIDFGCGAGNLTKHLTSVGVEVIACDVSIKFLNLVFSRTYES